VDASSEAGAVGVAVGKSKLREGVGVSINSEVAIVSGVDAWSVANRSGVGVEAAGRWHPATRSRVKAAGASLSLLVICLIDLLTV